MEEKIWLALTSNFVTSSSTGWLLLLWIKWIRTIRDYNIYHLLISMSYRLTHCQFSRQTEYVITSELINNCRSRAINKNRTYKKENCTYLKLSDKSRPTAYFQYGSPDQSLPFTWAIKFSWAHPNSLERLLKFSPFFIQLASPFRPSKIPNWEICISQQSCSLALITSAEGKLISAEKTGNSEVWVSLGLLDMCNYKNWLKGAWHHRGIGHVFPLE